MGLAGAIRWLVCLRVHTYVSSRPGVRPSVDGHVGRRSEGILAQVASALRYLGLLVPSHAAQPLTLAASPAASADGKGCLPCIFGGAATGGSYGGGYDGTCGYGSKGNGGGHDGGYDGWDTLPDSLPGKGGSHGGSDACGSGSDTCSGTDNKGYNKLAVATCRGQDGGCDGSGTFDDCLPG